MNARKPRTTAASTFSTVPTSVHGRPRWSNDLAQGERPLRQQAAGILGGLTGELASRRVGQCERLTSLKRGRGGGARREGEDKGSSDGWAKEGKGPRAGRQRVVGRVGSVGRAWECRRRAGRRESRSCCSSSEVRSGASRSPLCRARRAEREGGRAPARRPPGIKGAAAAARPRACSRTQPPPTLPHEHAVVAGDGKSLSSCVKAKDRMGLPSMLEKDGRRSSLTDRAPPVLFQRPPNIHLFRPRASRLRASGGELPPARRRSPRAGHLVLSDDDDDEPSHTHRLLASSSTFP